MRKDFRKGGWLQKEKLDQKGSQQTNVIHMISQASSEASRQLVYNSLRGKGMLQELAQATDWGYLRHTPKTC